MTDALATTSTAADSPTPRGPLSTPVQPAAPRPGSISAADFSRLPQAEQDRFAILRAPDGGQEYVRRDQLEKTATAEPTIKPAGDTSATTQPTVTADGKLKVGSYELSADDVAMLMQTKAAADLKATQVPDDASKYLAKLPEGLKLPEGMDFHPDPNDPAFKDFQALSKKLGLTQSDFEQLYGIWASKTVQSEATFRDAMRLELEKLGANATMRVTALETWLRGMVGDDLAKSMRQGMFSAKIVEGLEKIATQFASQGHGSFTQHGRVLENPSTGPLSSMSDEIYNATSASERYRLSRLG